MSDEADLFKKYVIRGILANNPYEITEVNSLKSLKSIYFIKEDYEKIERLIKAGNLKAIQAFPEFQTNNEEYLEVMIFNDSKMREFIVTVYDSILLEQDPQVIEIFPII